MRRLLVLLLHLWMPILRSAKGASVEEHQGAVLGCNPDTLSDGFTVSYYSLPLVGTRSPCYNPIYSTESYIQGGYENVGAGKIGTSYGVTNLTFDTGTTGFTTRCVPVT